MQLVRRLPLLWYNLELTAAVMNQRAKGRRYWEGVKKKGKHSVEARIQQYQKGSS